jgi:hypothetical protein
MTPGIHRVCQDTRHRAISVSWMQGRARPQRIVWPGTTMPQVGVALFHRERQTRQAPSSHARWGPSMWRAPMPVSPGRYRKSSRLATKLPCYPPALPPTDPPVGTVGEPGAAMPPNRKLTLVTRAPHSIPGTRPPVPVRHNKLQRNSFRRSAGVCLRSGELKEINDAFSSLSHVT